MDKNTLVISAYPGTGKTTLFEAVENAKIKLPDEQHPVILDSDSSKFSWIEPGVRHPDFPGNYIAHIKENIGKADIIMTSTHKVVRDALKEAGINFVLIYPMRELKDEYLQRYVLRGSPESFVKLMTDKWDEFVTELEMEDVNKYELSTGQGISFVLSDSHSFTQQFLRCGIN